MVFAARIPSSELAGMGELRVEGLQETDARTLLDSVLTGPLDTRVRDQILAETHGNPLALLELPRGLTSQQLAGRFGLPGAVDLSGGIEENFRRRVDVLPDQTRRLLLIAAAEPIGDPALVWGAAARLGIGAEATAPATEAGLIEFGMRVRFRHPLVRSVVYGSALPQERQEVHACAGGGHRSATGSRSTRLASGPCRGWARRGRRRGIGAVGGPGASAWRHGCGGGIPRARHDVDARPRPPHRAGAGRRVGKIKAGAFDAARDLLSIAEAGLPERLSASAYRSDEGRARVRHKSGQ